MCRYSRLLWLFSVAWHKTMKEYLTPNERAKIYETAWRVYCSTQSSDYAYRQAGTCGFEMHVSPIRTNEIARDAIEKIQKLQRAYVQNLLEETPERVDLYVRQFPSISNPYRPEDDDD